MISAGAFQGDSERYPSTRLEAFLFSVDVWMIVLIWKQKRTGLSWKLFAAALKYGIEIQPRGIADGIPTIRRNFKRRF